MKNREYWNRREFLTLAGAGMAAFVCPSRLGLFGTVAAQPGGLSKFTEQLPIPPKLDRTTGSPSVSYRSPRVTDMGLWRRGLSRSDDRSQTRNTNHRQRDEFARSASARFRHRYDCARGSRAGPYLSPSIAPPAWWEHVAGERWRSRGDFSSGQHTLVFLHQRSGSGEHLVSRPRPRDHAT